MKKTVTLLPLLLLLIGATASAQRLKAKHPVIDVGQVIYRQPVAARFELRNNEGRALTIDSVDTSCGCTTVELPVRPVGGNTDFTVTVSYDAKLMGHFEKYVDIYANGRREPLHLTLKGVVVNQVSEYQGQYDLTIGELMADRNTIDFGDIRQGETPFADIHIKNPTSKPVSPVVMHQPNYLSSEVSPTTIPPGKSGIVRLILQSVNLKDMGLTQTTVYLGSRPGDRVREDKAVDVSVVMLPNFQNMSASQQEAAPHLQLSDNEISFGSFEGKAKKTVYVVLENTGSDVLTISALQILAEGLKVSLPKRTIRKGEHVKMKIVGEKRLMQQQKTNPRIQIITNDPQKPKVVLDAVYSD